MGWNIQFRAYRGAKISLNNSYMPLYQNEKLSLHSLRLFSQTRKYEKAVQSGITLKNSSHRPRHEMLGHVCRVIGRSEEVKSWWVLRSFDVCYLRLIEVSWKEVELHFIEDSWATQRFEGWSPQLSKLGRDEVCCSFKKFQLQFLRLVTQEVFSLQSLEGAHLSVLIEDLWSFSGSSLRIQHFHSQQWISYSRHRQTCPVHNSWKKDSNSTKSLK